MANALAPVVSSSIRYDNAPIEDPPKTEFPYLEEGISGQQGERERIGSEDTLTEKSPLSHNRGSSGTDVPAQERPQLASTKYGTELVVPVGTRSVAAQQRHSTGAPPNNTEPLRKDSEDSTSSDSEWSSDEEDANDIQRRGSRPQHADLGPRELNRARMRPWHDNNGKRHKVQVGNDQFKSSGRVAKDGRLNVKISEMANTGYLAKTLGNAIQSHLHPSAKDAEEDVAELQRHYADQHEIGQVPRMNIVIMVIGSRGDVQPFLKIGQLLRDKYGHRVRIATHPTFRKFIQDEQGLEFFSIGGDPSELMSFMVRNPGLIPSFETLTSGEVGRRRDQMFEMFNGFWRACINATDDEKDTANLKMLGNKAPFIADAIIANPVSFAHYHCAERLGIPLHLVFTFPYTPTTQFPHPLANIKASNVDREYTNYMSYPLVDLMTWQGLGDLVNRFRVKTLGLEPVSTLWAPGQLSRMRVPMTYLWSPGLVPKPEDWGPEIDIAGYVFLDLADIYKPPAELTEFLSKPGPKIYIGFGSIAGIKDTEAFCTLLFEAVKSSGVRAVISRGWGGMGDGMDIPEQVFMIDNVPHDWLFPQLDAVCHHGGAGTTAAGLRYGKPTMIVPFFGDQPFWAQMIVRADAGAKQVWPLKQLTPERFATSIKECLRPGAKKNAQAIAKSIAAEGDGADNAVDSFHRGLRLGGKHSVRCDVFDDRIATWRVKHTNAKLSALAADLLLENKRLATSDLELLRHKKWADFSGPGEPITGAGGVIVAAFQEAFHGITSIHDDAKADWKKIAKHKQKKKSKEIRNIKGDIEQPAEMQLDKEDEFNAKVNMHGEAEPLRRPNVTGVLPGDHSSIANRPQASRASTTSTLAEPAPIVLTKDVGKGLGHSLKPIVLLPSDMLHAVTLGFRNAPRLYGDRTVRPPPSNIKGLRQGTKIAGKEFVLGVYDGTTGLVKIPYLDMKQDGIAGLPKGLARGVGGVVLKPVAGTLGLVDYTNKGLYASLRKLVRDTEKTDRFIRKARLMQGSLEVKDLRKQEQNKQSARQGGELEQARTRALTRFTTNDRKQLEEARKKEKRHSIIPSRLSRSEKQSVI